MARDVRTLTFCLMGFEPLKVKLSAGEKKATKFLSFASVQLALPHALAQEIAWNMGDESKSLLGFTYISFNKVGPALVGQLSRIMATIETTKGVL